jgi:hypothetical protein
MKSLNVRWRIYLNLLLLSTVLITSFQNCTDQQLVVKANPNPIGVEVITE